MQPELVGYIRDLKQQKAEFVAYCEDLRKQLSIAGGTIEYLEDGFPFTDGCKEVKEDSYKLITKNPQQSLAKIQADALDDMMDELSGNINYDSVSEYITYLREKPNQGINDK